MNLRAQRLSLIFLTLAMMSGDVVMAQAPGFAWVREGVVLGSPYNAATGRKIVADAAGNSYVTGDFDGPSLTLGNIVLTAPPANNGALFVVKYDPQGNALWAKTTTKCRSMGTGIALDGSGKVYLVGTFTFPNPYTDTASFGAFNFVKTNGTMFVSQLDAATGNVNWMKQAVASQSGSNVAQGTGIAVFGNNEIYVSGTFNGTVSFGNLVKTSVGYYDAYLVKYNSNGQEQWIQTGGGLGQTSFAYLTTDKVGNIYAGGVYQNKLYVGTDTFNNVYKSMLVKYDAAGNYKWARSSGGNYQTGGVSKLAHDNQNNIYVLGLFAVNNGNISWGANSLTNTTGNYITYLAKYDTSGNAIWLKSPGGSFNAYNNPGIDFDAADNFYLTGAFFGIATFGTTILNSTVNGNTEDIYVAKFDYQANSLWAKQVTGSYGEQAGDIATDPLGDVFITGNCRAGNANVDVFFDTIKISIPSNQKHAITAKIGPVPATINAAFSHNDSTICAGSSLAFTDQSTGSPTSWNWTFTGGTPSNSSAQNPTVTYASSGTYDVKLVVNNASGKDSVTKTGYVIVHPSPVLDLTASDTLLCSGDSTQVCVTGSFTSYIWNTGSTGTCTFAKDAGGYWLTVTDANGCSAVSDHQEISVFPIPSISIVVQGDTLSSYNATSYQWYFNDAPIAGATSPVYVAQQSGEYSLRVVDVNGCSATSNKVPVIVDGVSEATDNLFRIYPNPCTSLLFIEVTQIESVEVKDVLGRIVYQVALLPSVNKWIVNMQEQPSEIYFITMKQGERQFQQKIIKQ